MPPSTTIGNGSSQIASRRAPPTSRQEKLLIGFRLCRFTQMLYPDNMTSIVRPGKIPARKRLIDTDFRNDAVKNQGQGRREQQSPRLPDDVTRPRLKRSLYPSCFSAGYKMAPKRDNRYARRSCKSREERTGGQANKRKTTRHPTEHCIGQAHQSLGSVTLAKQVARKCK